MICDVTDEQHGCDSYILHDLLSRLYLLFCLIWLCKRYVVAIRDQEWIKLALFIFSNDVGLRVSPCGNGSRDTPTSFVSGPVLLCCFIPIFPRFYLISFLIYLFICHSLCLMVAMLMSISTFFE